MLVSGTLLVTGAFVILATLGRAPAAYAAQPAVGLGTATSFAVLAGSAVTNTGPSTVSGDLGVSPGTAATGFPPGQVDSGVSYVADAVALQAQQDLTTAYDDAAGRNPVVDKTGDDLGGETLVPGVYQAATGLSLTGTVTLDAQGDSSAVFVFQAGSTLLTATGSRVALQGGAQACNVFWQIGSSATIGSTTSFVGTVMALASITVQTGATVQGRVLARTGQVSLDTNTITRPNCTTVTPTNSVAPTNTPRPTPAVTPTVPAGPPSGNPGVHPALGTTAGPTVTDSAGTAGVPQVQPTTSVSDGAAGMAWVPDGHPATGRVPLREHSDAGLWLGGGLCVLGAAVGGAAVLRPRPLRRT